MTTRTKKILKSICVIDVETDPFETGKVPAPFLWGFFDGSDYRTFLTKSAMFEHLISIKEKGKKLVVWAHNGGKFDFWYLAEEFDEFSEPMIVAGRLMEVQARGITFRDSYSLIPVPLSAWQKSKIDYSKFTRTERHKHLAEIIDYLEMDCKSLHSMLVAFRLRFGDGLHTVAQASRRIAGTLLRGAGQRYPKATYKTDISCRPAYHGGRCEVFERGSFDTPLALWDIVSAYPWAMTFKHPCGGTHEVKVGQKYRESAFKFDLTNIYRIKADSDGALPLEVYQPEHRLIFPVCKETWFTVFGHEILAGLETDTVRIHEIRSQIIAEEQIDFLPFVTRFFDEKSQATKLEIRLFSKLVLNALSGKLGVNPARYQSHILIGTEYINAASVDPRGWTFAGTLGNLALLTRPYARREMHFGHVMTAGSITSMIRARLWREIVAARSVGIRPIYCDTDSLLLDSWYTPVTQKNGVGLGDWELKGTSVETHIVAPKLYALKMMDSKGHSIWHHRSAGANLSARQIMRLAKGKHFTWRSPVPSWQPGRTTAAFKEIRY